jgi:hypothetical protein
VPTSAKRLFGFAAQVLLWILTIVGCATTAASLTDLYMIVVFGVKPGTPIYLDDLAPTRTDTLLWLTLGLAIIAASIVGRSAIQKPQKAGRARDARAP